MRTSRIGGGAHGLRIDASLDERDRPVLAVADAEYNNMGDLVRDYPDLVSLDHLAQYCEAWLGLNHGSGYRLIQDPTEFKSRYHMVKQRGYTGVRGRTSVPSVGPYDLTEISEPQLYDDVLRCYVEDRVYGVPYRVELPWPMNAEALVQFVLLPLLDDEEEDYV